MKVQVEGENNRKERTECEEGLLPFVKLYRSPSKYYFFDVNKNKICEVDDEAYFAIERWLADGIEPDLASITSLRKKGWLSSRRPATIYNAMANQVPTLIQHDLATMILQVTQACNLSCIYCPYAVNKNNHLSRSHQNRTMTFETARKAIDYLYDHSDNSKTINLSFYGGEPIIAFSMIQHCVEYADQLFDGKEIHYGLTTNATLMSDEIIDYLARHRFNLVFSMDGPQYIHDRHRRRADGTPTYDLVMETLRKTVIRYKALGAVERGMLMINAVINPEDSPEDFFSWLSEEWAKDVIVQASIIEDYYLEKKFDATEPFTTQMRYQLALSMLSFLDIVPNLKTCSITDGSVTKSAEAYSIISGNKEELGDVANPGGPCISGVSKLFVNVDGFFYPCEKVNELSDSMKIGDVDHGLNSEQIIHHMNIAQLTSEKCKNCWAQSHCNICQRQADGGSELSGQAKSRFCKEVYATLDEMIRTYMLFLEARTLYKPIKGGARDEICCDLSNNQR